jgi:3-hydroxybutyryl-CoA dehydratase
MIQSRPTDVEFARGTLFGERVAHGLLGLSIASGLASRLGFIDGTARAFRELEWKFSDPIKIGDTIRARFEVRQKKKIHR